MFSGYLLAAAIFARAQNIDSTISIYGDKFGQERMYLHFDKSAYSAGETIWFKVYMMETIYPAGVSKSVYLDWTDNTGKILLHGVFPLVNGITNGQFDVPADYTGKSLHVRGYTRWMLNFDSAFLYNKDIRVISKNPTSTKGEVIAPTITFFPEGGDAVAGINNKIAFKANDQWGRPVKVKGSVVDKSGKVIAILTPVHDGMGFFFLTPTAGSSYTAKWKDDKNSEHTTPLPDIKENGVVMQVGLQDEKRILGVYASPEVAKAGGVLHIIGTMYQNVVFKINESIEKGVIQKTVPTQNLPSGILTITVFDGHWNPLSERITYVNNREYLFQSEFEVIQWGLSHREKDQVQISIPASSQ